jgi:hypothetical protein
VADTEVKPKPRRAGSAGRQTRPANWHPYQAGGIGVIPRRAIGDPAQLNSRFSLSSFAENSPLRLLQHLHAIDPDVALAHDTDVTMVCDPEITQIVAVDNPEDDTPNAEDTALLTAFWEAQPPEVGGLYGFMEQMLALFNFTGMACAEAVPGARGMGVYRAWPVDSLTIQFGRDSVDGDLVPYQRRRWESKAKSGWQRLSTDTFHYETVGKWPDNPYGCARYAPALAEVLVNISFWKSITDAVQNAAWPRLGFGLPYKELKELYQQVLGYDEVRADEAVAEDIEQFKREVASIMPDDNVFFDSNGKMMLIPGGTFEGIEQIITERRSRIIRALKQLPLFLGLNDSTTETQATQQKIIHGKRLNSLRSRILSIALKVCNLHLRLMGRPTIAKAIVQPIFPSDALVEVQTEAVRITNAAAKRDQGWIDQEQASMEVTGSGAVDEAPETQSDPETEPGEEEETRQERQSRERQSAQAMWTELRSMAREDMRAEYRERIQRRMQAERKELAEV